MLEPEWDSTSSTLRRFSNKLRLALHKGWSFEIEATEVGDRLACTHRGMVQPATFRLYWQTETLASCGVSYKGRIYTVDSISTLTDDWGISVRKTAETLHNIALRERGR